MGGVERTPGARGPIAKNSGEKRAGPPKSGGSGGDRGASGRVGNPGGFMAERWGEKGVGDGEKGGRRGSK